MGRAFHWAGFTGRRGDYSSRRPIGAVVGDLKQVRVVLASEDQLDAVRGLWREYWAALRLPDTFQNFAAELGTLPGVYAPPSGRLLLALLDNQAAGTVALRPIHHRACEAKRLYVRPQHRGNGIGRLLLRRLVEEARTAGYEQMYGDTLPSMGSALRMYHAFGFSETGPYSDDPTPGAIYLRLLL